MSSRKTLPTAKAQAMMEAACGIAMFVAIAGLSTAADAQSPKVVQRMALEAADLLKDVDYTNQICEATLTATFDWGGAPEDDLFKYSPEGYCNAALRAIQQVCRDPAGKTYVKRQIKSLTCDFGATRSIALKDGVIDYKINFSSANDIEFVYEFLENKL